MRKPNLNSAFSAFEFPHPVDEGDVPLPRALFYLTCISILNAFILLLISCLDLGYFSYWINPPLSLITLIYHCIVLLVARQKRRPEDPSYFSTTIVCAYVLAVFWLAALVATITALVISKGKWVEILAHHGLPASAFTQRLQCALDVFGVASMSAFGVKGNMIANEDGDPANWRPILDKT
ncbi:hypothetical protein K435DRAFT_8214 [Dendrothele bispora CBS 962.96]|uniref:MARVEL domain-containing protein n=1 Tax=Dendrothele bispora (strain CBS 962.96) TaxID=1314807 RepID=A0A4S8MY27_DENBC|nr:hypothetical protein K435DRAFT_8214 [Dendrothele bispora CBS 962.96]